MLLVWVRGWKFNKTGNELEIVLEVNPELHVFQFLNEKLSTREAEFNNRNGIQNENKYATRKS